MTILFHDWLPYSISSINRKLPYYITSTAISEKNANKIFIGLALNLRNFGEQILRIPNQILKQANRFRRQCV